MSRNKISATDKLSAIHQILDGSASQRSTAKTYGVTLSSVQKWLMKYRSMGKDAFFKTKNKRYSKELKLKAVTEYLSGFASQVSICKKYSIHSTHQLHQWILKYNGHEEQKASGTGGGAIMTQGRKTTFDERIEIVQYCISHEHNYAETSEKYKISYQQARNYTVKYETGGVDTLLDKRGKRKNEDELSELEKLRAENRILKAEKERAEMEASFLKKLDEIERRRG
jgi:transposase-like protein